MYLRFIVPGRAIRTGVDCGLFHPAYDLMRDRRTPESLACAIRHLLEWFERELPVPARDIFLIKSRQRWLSEGICWFRDDAREPIAQAFGLAALLDECGVPVTRVVTRRPGQILYSDRWQIVAKPEWRTPTRWQ